MKNRVVRRPEHQQKSGKYGYTSIIPLFLQVEISAVGIILLDSSISLRFYCNLTQMKYVYIILYNQTIRETKNINKTSSPIGPDPPPNPSAESPDHRPAL